MRHKNKPNKPDKRAEPDKRAFDWLSLYKRNWFSFLLFLAVALSAVMANVSKYNAHPDEIWHVAAGKFYKDHWLPPEIGDPRTASSYSVYGVSYLNGREIVYFLGGKFAALFSGVTEDYWLCMRLFNVLLFLGLAVFFLLKKDMRPALILLLATPQIWYVFGYFNGDAFPLFLSLLIVYQMVSNESLFNRYLNAPGWTRHIAGGVVMCVLLGLLLVSKLNYLIFFLFAVSYVAGMFFGFELSVLVFLGGVAFYLNSKGWPPFTEHAYFVFFGLFYLFLLRLFLKRIEFKKLSFVRLAKCGLVLSLASALLVSWVVYDRMQNGTKGEKAVKLAEMKEKYAEPQFKRSTHMTDQIIGLRLKSKGVSYWALFDDPLDWHKRTGKSASGAYGWLRIFGSETYYVFYWIVFFGFLGFVFGHGILKGGKTELIFLLLIGLFVLSMVYVITYVAWVVDYQAQGRHLFPLVGVLGAFLLRNRARVPEKGLSAFVLILFGLSFYSFVFVGLDGIPKIDF